MSLDAKLLQILACPQDKGALYYFEAEGFLYNPRLQRKYNIVEGIPVMLVDEAVTIDASEHDRLSQRILDRHIAPTFGS
ncbi:MAG: Trm112 family protein [Actinobacteria bacterium]|nr:MAG: Trm112 family protein [Actinomycetota bacterium]